MGNHGSKRIAAIYYGKDGVTDGKAVYTYDGMGNIISVNENGKQHYKYGYDKLGRIKTEKDLYKDIEICYTYDNNGNILTKSENGTVKEYKYYEGTDRLASYNGEVCEYDAAGNPTKYRNLSFEWSKGRQLTKLTDGEKSVEYTYDGSGLRRTKTSGGVTKTYDYENGRLVRESGGEEPVRFLYGEGGIIGIKYDRSKFLFRKNAFGDVTEVYNVRGELVAKYSYSAYGKCTIEYNKDNAAHFNPIRYRGYYYDEETGLYYLKSRYYDPETGRFLNADDISYLDPETINGLNLYAYCGNNPVMRIDENGNAWWDWLISGLQIVVGAVLVFTGLGAGFGAMLIAGGTIGLIGNAVGSTIGGGIGTMLNGWGAFSTGISLLSFGIPGIIAGIGLMAIGGATMLMGANEVVSGITGTNYLQNWMGNNLYDSLYAGLNIASAVGTIAGRLGMRAVGTITGKAYKNAKPYSRITDGYKTVQYDGKGNIYWSIHRTSHSKIWISNPHWHLSAGRGEHYTNYWQLILAILRRF